MGTGEKLGPEDRIIVAVPGFQVVTFWMEDDREDPERKRNPDTFDIKANLDRETVIAWRLNADWYPEAILPGRCAPIETGVGSSGEYIVAILDPAGCVIGQDNQVYRNLDGWIEYVRERWRALRHKLPPPPGSKPRLVVSKPHESVGEGA